MSLLKYTTPSEPPIPPVPPEPVHSDYLHIKVHPSSTWHDACVTDNAELLTFIGLDPSQALQAFEHEYIGVMQSLLGDSVTLLGSDIVFLSDTEFTVSVDSGEFEQSFPCTQYDDNIGDDVVIAHAYILHTVPSDAIDVRIKGLTHFTTADDDTTRYYNGMGTIFTTLTMPAVTLGSYGFITRPSYDIMSFESAIDYSIQKYPGSGPFSSPFAGAGRILSFNGLDGTTSLDMLFAGPYTPLHSVPTDESLMSLSNVTSCNHAFEHASNLNSDIIPLYRTLMRTCPDESHSKCFTGCCNAMGFQHIPVSWGGMTTGRFSARITGSDRNAILSGRTRKEIHDLFYTKPIGHPYILTISVPDIQGTIRSVRVNGVRYDAAHLHDVAVWGTAITFVDSEETKETLSTTNYTGSPIYVVGRQYFNIDIEYDVFDPDTFFDSSFYFNIEYPNTVTMYIRHWCGQPPYNTFYPVSYIFVETFDGLEGADSIYLGPYSVVVDIPQDGYDALAAITDTRSLFGSNIKVRSPYTGNIYPLYKYLSQKEIPVVNHNYTFSTFVNSADRDMVPVDWGGTQS